MHTKCLMKGRELEFELSGVIETEKKLIVELMPEVLPSLKGNIKESAIDASDENDGVSAASARVPVAYAILAAYQFRWFVAQVFVYDHRHYFFLLKIEKNIFMFYSRIW